MPTTPSLPLFKLLQTLDLLPPHFPASTPRNRPFRRIPSAKEIFCNFHNPCIIRPLPLKTAVRPLPAHPFAGPTRRNSPPPQSRRTACPPPTNAENVPSTCILCPLPLNSFRAAPEKRFSSITSHPPNVSFVKRGASSAA